jgi:hypothetical protein
MPNIPIGTLYYAENCQHVNDELFYVSKSGESVLDKFMQGMPHESLKKIIQLDTMFYLLQKGKPMLKYFHFSYNSFKWRIVHRSISLTTLASPWLK